MKRLLFLLNPQLLMVLCLIGFQTASFANPPDWVATPNLQNNMQLIGVLELSDGNISLDSDDLIGAFVENECRGVASPLGAFNGLIFLTIGSNISQGEEITFKAYLANEDVIVDLSQIQAFQNQLLIGTPDNPYIFNYQSNEPPTWEPTPNLQFNMQLIAVLVLLDGSISINPDDIIGAFVQDECRGVASPFSFYDGLIFLTVGSNVSLGEEVSFKAYLSDQNLIVDLNQVIIFENQKLVGSPDNPFVLSYNELVNHQIQLQPGWSGVSSFLIPTDSNVQDLLSSIAPNLIIFNSLTGVYYPAGNMNTIVDWDYTAGYQIKVDAPVMLEISGSFPTDKSIVLSQGWNLMPVLSENEISVIELFAGNLDKLNIAKEAVGLKVFWPEKQISTLEMLVPGKSYLVKMNQNAVIEF